MCEWKCANMSGVEFGFDRQLKCINTLAVLKRIG